MKIREGVLEDGETNLVVKDEIKSWITALTEKLNKDSEKPKETKK